jgi:hypothetical protein
MNTQSLIQLEFFFHDRNVAHRKALQRVHSTLRAAGVNFELSEKPVEAETHRSFTLPALPCLRRVSPLPERFLVGRFDSPEKLLTSLGLTQVR